MISKGLKCRDRLKPKHSSLKIGESHRKQIMKHRQHHKKIQLEAMEKPSLLVLWWFVPTLALPTGIQYIEFYMHIPDRALKGNICAQLKEDDIQRTYLSIKSYLKQHAMLKKNNLHCRTFQK